jgi:hypothetical protein
MLTAEYTAGYTFDDACAHALTSTTEAFTDFVTSEGLTGREQSIMRAGLRMVRAIVHAESLDAALDAWNELHTDLLLSGMTERELTLAGHVEGVTWAV